MSSYTLLTESGHIPKPGHLTPDRYRVVHKLEALKIFLRLCKKNVSSERCAILRYQEIANFTNGKDYTTCDIAKHILAEEEEHEQDLQDYLTDIARMKESFLKK